MPVGTGNISMTDVQTEMATSPTNLIDMVTRANATGGWDATYSGSKDSLANFRGYNDSVATNTLSRSPSSLSFNQASATKTFSVNSNTTWSVTDNRSWISTSGASGSGNDGSINCTVAFNGTGATRTGTITISTTSGSPSLSVTILVTQGANPI